MPTSDQQAKGNAGENNSNGTKPRHVAVTTFAQSVDESVVFSARE